MQPNNPTSNLNASIQEAIQLRQSGKMAEAESKYRNLLSSFPNHPVLLTELGIIASYSKKYEEALRLLGQALEVDPNQVLTLFQRGNVFKKLNRLHEALADYDKLILLNPNFIDVYNNRGNTLKILKRLDEALLSYDKAIELNPDFAEAYNNRGNALFQLQRLEEALTNYNHAIRLRPDYASAYWNKSLTALQMGNYLEGWKLFEWRWKDFMQEHARHFSQPLWLGQESISGKTLLIHAEQGYGDSIQFCRYAYMAEELGAKVLLEVPEGLISLMSTLVGCFIVVKKEEVLPNFDLHCPIMSLPLAFKTTLNNIPSRIPYLFPDNRKCEYWQKSLGEKGLPRIGLVWSGSANHLNDHNRSIPLQLFEPLFELPFEFHALQKEFRTEDEAILSKNKITLHQADLNDFSDTAALMEQMDLIISVDTAGAHLAGALGKPVWILLPYSPDYRWMLDREDTPWYPTAALLRQSAPGDWSHVISELMVSLRADVAPR